MGGSPLTPEIRNLIIITWRNMRNENNEPASKEVRAEVAKIVDKEPDKYEKLPELRTFQEIIREAKKKLRNKSLDEPWSMAHLAKYELPPESIPYVAKVWRYSINSGEKFTVIQAKWVARLYRFTYNNLSPSDDVTLLWYYSGWYANMEKIAILAGYDLDTFFIDADTQMTDWEFMSLLYTDFSDRMDLNVNLQIRYYRPLPTKQGQIVEELLHTKDIIELGRFYSVPDLKENLFTEYFRLILDLPTLSSLNFDYDTKMVYLCFYSFLIRLPRWDELPPKKQVELIVELRNWVLEYSQKIKNDPQLVQKIYTAPAPTELFRKAGYELCMEEEL